MNVYRAITEPVRTGLTWHQLWMELDRGLIACWENGRGKAIKDGSLASRARAGELVILPFRGGVERELKKQQKFGSLFYLAMWQGLRNEDLGIDTEGEHVPLKCVVSLDCLLPLSTD